MPHLDHEKEFLLPALAEGRAASPGVADELRDTRRDHLQLTALLDRIREMSGHFAAPEWACHSYRTLAGELAGLDGGLRALVQLEGDVLLPRLLDDDS